MGSRGRRLGSWYRAVNRLSRDPARRTCRRGDGPDDSDGGTVSAPATPLSVPLRRATRARKHQR
jgi:hypothetical protein